jgi:pimeloyl-ACP methyl ester carboxylesterase
MMSWPDNYCRLLAAGGRFVIRYDERDTGQSTSFEPYKPPYTLSDLAKDAIGVLDGYGVQRAHVCGISEGGMVVQHLTLDHSNRLLSAIIQSSSPEPNGIMGAATGQIESWVLPPPLPSIIDLTKMLTTVDWHDPVQAVGAWVTESSAMCGNDYPVDEDVALTLAREEVHRARNIVSQRFNHTIAIHNTPRWRHRLASVRTRTLVLHGSADPCFPIAHAKALAREIPQANLLVIEGMGHDVFPRTWTKVATAALEHTDH